MANRNITVVSVTASNAEESAAEFQSKVNAALNEIGGDFRKVTFKTYQHKLWAIIEHDGRDADSEIEQHDE